MKSKLLAQKPATTQLSTERWVRLLPDHAGNYALYDAMRGMHIGRILFDEEDNWIYDGMILSLMEQEDLAGFITGHQKEMDQLIKSL